MSTFYITTPIYYVNDAPHIGHAYTTVAADVLARYWRLKGRTVFFLTGLDEHGQKVQQAAAKVGVDPQQYCDGMVPRFRELWNGLSISNDAFIRTTDAYHKSAVQKYVKDLFDKGLIYKAEYTGWYCTFDERFWTEKDVVDGLCPDCKRPVEQLGESNYFFRMSKFQSQLIQYIEAHPDFIRPRSRCNEVLGFLQKPLEDLSISRPKSRLSWGIDLPFDPHYVTYVWFDALINYVSALDYLAATPSFNQFWPATIHLVGKDILTTHAVYWSTMLMALELTLPQMIFAHGWWTVNGEKMSKSRGNVVDPYAMVEEFGADAFRYFLLREVPFGQDGDFSRQALVGRINSDLANGLGNLLSRTLTMIERYTEGRIPSETKDTLETDNRLQSQTVQLASSIESGIKNLDFNRVLESIWGLVQVCDQHIDQSAPWNLAKRPEDRQKLNNILYRAAETLRFLAVAICPFMPNTAEEMKRQLGLETDFSRPMLATDMQWGGLKAGTAIAKGQPLFPRIHVTTSTQGAATVTQDQQPSLVPQPADVPPVTTGPVSLPAPPTQITIDEFQKIQLKTAKVLTAERVPRSEKLLKLQVDLGTEQRQIVAGIGKKYEPEALIGKRIVIVSNLKPAKLMGIESQGMVLAAGDQDVGGLITVLEEVDPGTKVK
ncbi:MAG: methionine--tRNA ligase [Nitrospiraceae bacterium]